MAKPAHRSWFRIALARADGAAGALVASAGEHVGAAIQAAEAQFAGTFVVGVEPASTDSIPLGESVGKSSVVELGPLDAGAQFAWPIGVVPQLGHAVPDAAAGYIIHDDPDRSIFEAQVARDDITETFMGLVERLPSADNLELKILDHFESAAQTDVWLTSRVNAKKVLAFLDDYDAELFGNGHVELGVYIRAKKATLRLTEHKTIVWIAEDRGVDGEVKRWFHELEVAPRTSLAFVTNAPHVHYRPAKSRDRKKLGEELYRQRMRRVATEKPDS